MVENSAVTLEKQKEIITDFLSITKLSDWLERCLHDLELCEKDSNYEISMDDWHRSNENTNFVCYVCFGGSVLAKTFCVDHTKSVVPRQCLTNILTMSNDSFSVNEWLTHEHNTNIVNLAEILEHSLYAADTFRRGYIFQCAEYWYGPRTGISEDVLTLLSNTVHDSVGTTHCHYNTQNSDQFKQWARDAINVMKELGY